LLAFDNVNFAAGGPGTLFAQGPEGGPGGATGGHVLQVEDEYRLVVRGLRGDAYAVSPTRGRANDGPIVCADDERISEHWERNEGSRSRVGVHVAAGQ
jgi:hypothetical protein